MGFYSGDRKILDMVTRSQYNTRLGGKITRYSKIYSFCKLLDCQKVLDLRYSGDLNRVNFGRSSKKNLCSILISSQSNMFELRDVMVTLST